MEPLFDFSQTEMQLMLHRDVEIFRYGKIILGCGTEYSQFPFNEDVFPLVIDECEYSGSVFYDTDGIWLQVKIGSKAERMNLLKHKDVPFDYSVLYLLSKLKQKT